MSITKKVKKIGTNRPSWVVVDDSSSCSSCLFFFLDQVLFFLSLSRVIRISDSVKTHRPPESILSPPESLIKKSWSNGFALLMYIQLYIHYVRTLVKCTHPRQEKTQAFRHQRFMSKRFRVHCPRIFWADALWREAWFDLAGWLVVVVLHMVTPQFVMKSFFLYVHLLLERKKLIIRVGKATKDWLEKLWNQLIILFGAS